jgi:UDP-N-acetylglucosamine:LPS N-acetylglucosamine transferase
MADDDRRRRMAKACKNVARPNAASEIAERLLAMVNA